MINISAAYIEAVSKRLFFAEEKKIAPQGAKNF